MPDKLHLCRVSFGKILLFDLDIPLIGDIVSVCQNPVAVNNEAGTNALPHHPLFPRGREIVLLIHSQDHHDRFFISLCFFAKAARLAKKGAQDKK